MLPVVKIASFSILKILRIPGLKMIPVFKGSLYFFTMAFNLAMIMSNFARLLQNSNCSQKVAVFKLTTVFKIISKN